MLPARAAIKLPKRKDNRIIIHFDYDCFYASVFEAENPALKSLPLAVQQKHIIVTCNYVAREKGLRKLQLITEAKKLCPEAVIVLGEDLTRFRDASKLLYNFLRAFSWNDRAERLGFDEVWLDVTDLVDYNIEVLNKNDPANAFFQLSITDPTSGFSFDATKVAGHTYPSVLGECPDQEQSLRLRLILGSHLAFHIRHQLEEHVGYTSTVGISTSKLLSKLVGNVHKPRSQTTLMPPYDVHEHGISNAQAFIDDHDIGKIPGIGFKLAQKLREHVLQRPANFEAGLVYGPTRESVSVTDVRLMADLSADVLEKLLSGPGAPHGIGTKIWNLVHSVDDTEVSPARSVPRQISIEDSYVRLDTMEQVLGQMISLSTRLIERMRTDLTDIATEATENDSASSGLQNGKVRPVTLKYIAHPNTLRLTTRPRPPLNADGTRTRTFKRISRSTALPSFIFSLSATPAELAAKLTHESLVPLFKKLHPERSGWNLSLMNVAVTGMEDDDRGRGGDIGAMFKARTLDREHLRTPLSNEDSPDNDEHAVHDPPEDQESMEVNHCELAATGDTVPPNDGLEWQQDFDEGDDDDQKIEANDDMYTCRKCGGKVPFFAQAAHERYHSLGE